MEKLNLRQKLLEVSKAIEYLKKDKRNTGQNYNYLSEAKIKETIKAEFEKQGILFNYSTNNIAQYEISPTHKGTKQFVTNLNGTYKFLDVDSDAVIIGSWVGSGMDTGDKGLYKAITGGIKYVLNTNFLIPSGDDPENDGNKKPHQEPKKQQTTNNPPTNTQEPDKTLISEPQRKRLYAIGKSNGWKDEEMKELVVTFGYEHSKDIKKEDYKKICDMLEKGIAPKDKREELLDKIKKDSDENIASLPINNGGKQVKKKFVMERTPMETKILNLKTELNDDIWYMNTLVDNFNTEEFDEMPEEKQEEFATLIKFEIDKRKKGFKS